MPLDERWNRLTETDWNDFAAAWVHELRDEGAVPDSNVGQSVVMMNFTATAEHQWQFINAAVTHAESDDELAHIAAGPFEHLLSKHGEDYISIVEQRAASNSKFARMITGAWQHMMTDEVWRRVQAIQAACANPLARGDQSST